MEWLARPVVADGVVLAEPLDPARLTDADLRNICLRMHVILETIEMPNCEGRHLPAKLFDEIDTLESLVIYGLPSPSGLPTAPCLADWAGVIREFGEYYRLAGAGPIAVNLKYWQEASTRFAAIVDLNK